MSIGFQLDAFEEAMSMTNR